jgi:hypothetical protein
MRQKHGQGLKANSSSLEKTSLGDELCCNDVFFCNFDELNISTMSYFSQNY